MDTLKVGDRVRLRTGDRGTVIDRKSAILSEMPLHELVQLDNGQTFWYLRSVLSIER